MQDHELDAYLGGFDATDDQRERVKQALDTISEIYPLAEDDFLENESASNGATMTILGDDTLEGLAATHHRLKRNEITARYQLHGAIIAAVQAGMSESEAARVSGIGRLTVRKLLGK